MVFLSALKKIFKNKGDVFYSEGEMKIGLQLDEYIRVIELADIHKAKGIKSYVEVCKELYGDNYLDLIASGVIDKNNFWVDVNNRLTEELQIELDIDNLDSSIIDYLKIFYQNLDKSDTNQAKDVSKQILNKIGVNDNSLSLYHYLEYEIYKSINDFKKAYNALEKAIGLCYSNIYLSAILYFTQGVIKRPDLALEIFEKYYSKVKIDILTEDFLFNISNFFLSNKNYDIVIKICENILTHSNFKEDELWKYYFLSNLISAKISSFKINTKEEEGFITSNLDIIYSGINNIKGDNSIDLAKAYYSNYSMYYKKKFDVNMEMLKITTIHNFSRNSLFEDNMFIKGNFDLPKENLVKAKQFLNKAIEIKKNNNDFTDLGQTTSNLLVICLDEIKLKKLFKWKINHLSKERNLDYSSEILPFKDYTEIEINLNEIEEIIHTLPKLFPAESYQLSVNLTFIADDLKSILNEKTKLVYWCYRKALEVLPIDLKDENDLYLYLKKEII